MKIKKNSDKKRDAEENNSNADGQKKIREERNKMRERKNAHTPHERKMQNATKRYKPQPFRDFEWCGGGLLFVFDQINEIE